MGNSQAGRAMVQTALALRDIAGQTGQTPLEILDIACEAYRGCDAEFDEDTFPDHPFGQLLGQAFLNVPYEIRKDPEGDIWWE